MSDMCLRCKQPAAELLTVHFCQVKKILNVYFSQKSGFACSYSLRFNRPIIKVSLLSSDSQLSSETITSKIGFAENALLEHHCSHVPRVWDGDGLVPLGTVGEACRQRHTLGHHGCHDLLGRPLLASLHRHSGSISWIIGLIIQKVIQILYVIKFIINFTCFFNG